MQGRVADGIAGGLRVTSEERKLTGEGYASQTSSPKT
jgi:hypothetical protein